MGSSTSVKAKSALPRKVKETKTKSGLGGRSQLTSFTHTSSTQRASKAAATARAKRVDAELPWEAANILSQQVIQPVAGSSSAAAGSVDDEDSYWLDDATDEPQYRARDVLDGTTMAALSHEGGELQELMRHRSDTRDRHDRVKRQVDAFAAKMNAMSAALMEWDLDDSINHHGNGFVTRTPPLPCATAPPSSAAPADLGPRHENDPPAIQSPTKMEIIDLFRFFGTQGLHVTYNKDSLLPALVRLGLVPTAPIHPSFAVTVRTLEFYRITRNRCPRFAIRNFVRTLCDLHGVVFHPYLCVMFSVALDAYLAIRAQIAKQVAAAVGHDSPDWRLKNTCPVCMYKLKDEPDLGIDMLFTMDGNDSLKRTKRTVGKHDQQAGTFAPSCERYDGRELDSDYYIPRAEVDKWENVEAENTNVSGPPLTPCEGRWENMKPDSRKLTWGVFDETGLYLALCEHGFVLIMADMVRSGEGSKYFLATVEKLLMTIEGRLGGGYDIGCKSIKTLERSTLGETAKESGFRSLIGAFHGHCHCRQCQLRFLTIYTLFIGLADLENCERWFSKSNHLASSTRYESVFHRKQRIVNYAHHVDEFDTFPALAKYLSDNYKQALEILQDGPKQLADLLKAVQQRFPDLVITDKTVPGWLEDERLYFDNLKSEPPQDTMDITYHQALLKLEAAQKSQAAIADTWSLLTEDDFQTPFSDRTRTIETKRRHAIENRERAAAEVHTLESRIPAFQPRWLPGCPERQAATERLALREYRRRLDKLESLVVARLFELTKMNRSQTGYQLRKHIAAALKSRSHAINTAVDRYNEAARAIGRDEVEYKKVIEFAFLAEFDLLRETRTDIREQPWAFSSGRQAMDVWYKMDRAREEIQRVHVHARRLVTYLHDRKWHLLACEAVVQAQNPALAHQIRLYENIRGRATSSLLGTIKDLSLLPGFNGSVLPGTRLNHDSPSNPSIDHSAPPSPLPDAMDIDAPVSAPALVRDPGSLLPPATQVEMSEEMRLAEQDEAEDEQEVEDLGAILHILSIADG